MMRLKAITILCLILSAGTALSGKDQTERLIFTTGTGWKIANSSEARHYVIMEFVRDGDRLDDWKELLTIQNFGRSSSMHSPEQELNDLRAKRESECPGVTEWNVIEKNEGSILYEWHAKSCLGQPDQSEMAKIIFGKHNIFWLHYAAKGREFSPDARAEWIKRFTSAGIGSAP